MEDARCYATETEKADVRNDCAAAAAAVDDDDKPVSVHGNLKKLSAPTRRSSKANWTEEEDDILRDAVQKYEGKSWKKIAGCLPGRTDVQCLHRWQKVINPDLVKGPWSKEEDSILIELVKRSGEKKWSEIAEQLPGRMGKQCRERWYNHLKPEINKAAWTDVEERILINAHAEYGNKWSILAKLLPGRTENSVKNHWNCSLKKRLCSFPACGSAANHPRLTIPSLQADNNRVSRHSTETSQTPRTTNLDSGSYGASDCPSASRKARNSLRSLPSTSSKVDDARLKPCLVCSAPSETSLDNKRCNNRDDVCDNSLESSYTGLCYEPMQREDLDIFLSTGRFRSTESYIRGPGSRRDMKEPWDSYSRARSILRSAAISYRNVPSIIRKRAIQLLHKGISAQDNDVPKVVDDGDGDRVQSCTFLSQSLRSLQPLNLWGFEGEFRDA